jgi:alkanesulfonate monooxygenase SsuD/methylene tetrahydromethanopterin reductase-like flavin-dependent oxidoreductase (luciferase family)
MARLARGGRPRDGIPATSRTFGGQALQPRSVILARRADSGESLVVECGLRQMRRQGVKVGLFFQVPTTSPQTAAQRYQETIAQVRHADRLGFDTVWLAEGHFRPVFSVLPAPLVLAAALAVQTSRIRLGTASIILPLHHPLRVAEEAAMVDLLSGGRLELGVGRGSAANLAAIFGYEWEQRADRFDEQLAIIRQALSTGRVNHDGAHFQFQEIALTPLPLQRPAPPISITANHPEMATYTGQHGLAMLMGTAIHPLPEAFYAHVARYHAAFRPAPDQRQEPYVGAVFWVFPGRDLNDVRTRIGHSLANNHLAAQLSFETVAETFAIYGSPAACADKIRAIQARSGLDELICHFNPGGLVPSEQVQEAMTRFREEVVPLLT